MTTQIDLLGTTPVDAERDAILDLIAGDPVHARDREVVVTAIRDSVRSDGTVSANAWRPLVAGRVYSRVIGAVVHALVRAGVLVPTGQYERSTDTAGRNAGKPTTQYRWHATA